MSKIAFAVLCVFVFVLPWELFIQFPGFGTIDRLIGMGCFGLGLLTVVIRGGTRRLGLFHLVAALFVLWAGVTAIWSVDPEGTQDRFWTYVQLAFLTWLIWEIATTPERQRTLLQAYVLGAYISFVDMVHNYLTGTLDTGDRITATGFNPNDLGFTLVIGIPIAWYLAVWRRHGALAWINRLYIPCAMAGVAMTASRGSFIPALVTLLIIPWTMRQLRLRTRLAIVVAVVASAVSVLALVPESSWQRLATTQADISEGSFGKRARIWRAGLHVALEHPLVGVGAGAFEVATKPILGEDKRHPDGRAPHQTFLSVWVGQGIVGLALLLGLFGAAYLLVRRMPPPERKTWTILFLAMAIGLQARTWDYRKPVWFVFGMIIAQAAALRRGPETQPFPRPLEVQPRAGRRGASRHAWRVESV